MLKLFVFATIIALTYATLVDFQNALPTKEKCDTFTQTGENGGVDQKGCWEAGCGVCTISGVTDCRQQFVLSGSGVDTKLDANPCADGNWVRPGVVDVIPPRLIDEFKNNFDLRLTEEERNAIKSEADAKLTLLKQKCGAAATKADCIQAFNTWLGADATLTEAAIQAKIEEFRSQWAELENKLRELTNITIIQEREAERQRCHLLPDETLEQRKAKYQCMYDRQVELYEFVRNRIIGLNLALQFHRIQLVVLIRLSRDQIGLSLDVPAIEIPLVGTVDILKPFRETLLERLRDFIVLTLTMQKIKEKVVTAIQNRDKALALLQEIAQRIQQNVEKEVGTAISEIKAKIEDYKTGIRDFIKTYAKNAIECKTEVTTSGAETSIKVSCSISLGSGETKDNIKARFKEEVEAVIKAQIGVPEVPVTDPVDVVDPELQPQSTQKRGILQGTAGLSATGTLTDPNYSSAPTTSLSILLLLLALIATLF